MILLMGKILHCHIPAAVITFSFFASPGPSSCDDVVDVGKDIEA
jgi:hypothetical protein